MFLGDEGRLFPLSFAVTEPSNLHNIETFSFLHGLVCVACIELIAGGFFRPTSTLKL